MKWLALCLALLNLGLWFLPGQLPGAMVSPQVSGGLPRVASLKAKGTTRDETGVESVCLAVGWFETPALAHALGRTTGVKYQVKPKQESLPALHWVLVPPQPESDAKAQADNLRAQGADVYVVARGQYRNAISLGMFESVKAAENLMAKKKSENLNVTLAKFTRNRIGYALAFEVESSRETEVLQAVEAGFDGDFDFIERNACEGVATSEKNP
ncbi:MAG: hypothetical protein GYB26_15430 [Gammaproteobacteria bacterium]|nr:hypothetical protein [Gammaproteobacteria bacterium]